MTWLKKFIHRFYTIPRCNVNWHRRDAVFYNQYNKVVQCHRCGHVTDWCSIVPKY